MLLTTVNNVVARLNEENERIYNKGKKKENYTETSNKIKGVSRATLYNVAYKEEHTVSKHTATIIELAINEIRKVRSLEPINLDIKTYNSWEKRSSKV
jgi:hypothetical protein